jgi:predicted dehydrogenase
VVFVCTPNHLHLKYALLAAKAGCHLFVEKPLAHRLTGINQLIKICQKKNLIHFVGCNLRFHPALQFIKNYLAKNKLGKIYRIENHFGHYLPFWRPKLDYRKNYAAKISMGGGIILDDIHEFDLLFWLNNFQPVLKATLNYLKSSDLEIETEDNCLATFQFSNQVLGLVVCDYLQKRYSRSCKIVGQKGNLTWDFWQNIVWLENEKGRTALLKIKNFDFNQTYLAEIKYFFTCLANKKPTFNNFKTAFSVLKYCVKH